MFKEFKNDLKASIDYLNSKSTVYDLIEYMRHYRVYAKQKNTIVETIDFIEL